MISRRILLSQQVKELAFEAAYCRMGILIPVVPIT